MKVVVANLFLGGVIYAWWCRAGREWFVTGIGFGAVVLVFGLAMGIWCNQPKVKRRAKPPSSTRGSSTPDNSTFDDLTN